MQSCTVKWEWSIMQWYLPPHLTCLSSCLLPPFPSLPIHSIPASTLLSCPCPSKMFPITFQSEFISTSNPSTFEQNTLQLSLVTVYIVKYFETRSDVPTDCLIKRLKWIPQPSRISALLPFLASTFCSIALRLICPLPWNSPRQRGRPSIDGPGFFCAGLYGCLPLPHHLCTCPRGYMGTTHWVEALVCTEIDLGLIRGTILEAGYRRHTWYNGRATIQKPPNLDLDPDQV